MGKVAGVSHLAIATILKVATSLGFVSGVDGVHLVLAILLLLLLTHGLLLLLRISSLLGNLMGLHLGLRRLLDLLWCHLRLLGLLGRL